MDIRPSEDTIVVHLLIQTVKTTLDAHDDVLGYTTQFCTILYAISAEDQVKI